VDINGAKALKKRLAQNGADEALPASADVDVDVADDAPPVYHWTGVRQAAPESPHSEAHDEPTTSRMSLFRWLGLNFR
jgi:hypothetical protein